MFAIALPLFETHSLLPKSWHVPKNARMRAELIACANNIAIVNGSEADADSMCQMLRAPTPMHGRNACTTAMEL